jgi:hypothetical protein
MAFFLVSAFLAIFKPEPITGFLFGAATLCLFGYMTWCIRAARRRDSMPPDPPLGRGPDPFLSGHRHSRNVPSSGRRLD